MFLTKAVLNRGAGRTGAIAAQLLSAAERDAAHRLVWTLFSETGDENRDFLYRAVEPGEYFVLSRRAPCDPNGMWTLATREFTPHLRAGDRLQFLLRANPAQSVRAPGARRGARVDAVMNAKRPREKRTGSHFGPPEAEAAALAWLYKRAERLGVLFDETTCQVSGYRVEWLSRGFRRRPDQDTRFGVADFEGALEVIDPDRLLAALASGVGKAKAYGCGLLLIRPA